MKKLTLFLTVAAAGLAIFASDASAQRIVVETPGTRYTPNYRGDRRIGYELDRLNRDLRQTRHELRAFRGEGRRIHSRFDRVQRATERLNYEYERRLASSSVMRRRIAQVRVELDDIRGDLRVRGWR